MNKYESSHEQVDTELRQLVNKHDSQVTQLQLQYQQLHQQLSDTSEMVADNVEQISKILLILERMTE